MRRTLFHGLHKSAQESEEEKDTESDVNDEPFNEARHDYGISAL